MTTREQIDHYFGDPSFEDGSADPIPTRVVRAPTTPLPVPARDGIPHCRVCLYYHRPDEPCVR